jgi:hypothetical protein
LREGYGRLPARILRAISQRGTLSELKDGQKENPLPCNPAQPGISPPKKYQEIPFRRGAVHSGDGRKNFLSRIAQEWATGKRALACEPLRKHPMGSWNAIEARDYRRDDLLKQLLIMTVCCYRAVKGLAGRKSLSESKARPARSVGSNNSGASKIA